MQNLQQAIGYTFKNQSLLEEALTHSSCDKRDEQGAGVNNERLEFLGDRVLNFTVADLLFRAYGEDNEGRLSKRHAALVKQEMLAQIADNIGLGAALKLGKGENASGGREKATILSDALEAVIAAIYIDGGLEAARTFISTRWEPMMHDVRLKDPKSRLQELLQSKGLPLPEYYQESVKGEAHARVFVFRVSTPTHGEGTGEGTSKQAAQQAAAADLLEKITGKKHA
ncbi:MAG: ribonuclease III [Proteobacteria bacterium]|nr:ribonuclease III [Pseudomonadota bacterium]